MAILFDTDQKKGQLTKQFIIKNHDFFSIHLFCIAPFDYIKFKNAN